MKINDYIKTATNDALLIIADEPEESQKKIYEIKMYTRI